MKQLRNHIEEILPLCDEDFSFIASHFSTQHFKKGDYLVRMGEAVPQMFFVASGLLKLFYLDELGKEHILSFPRENWWETDYLAFNMRTKAKINLQCLEDSEILCITLKDYQDLCSRLPKIEHFFLEKATFGHIAAQQRILSLLSSSAEARYEQLLKQYPTLLQRVSKTLLASYLGVSRETLSRLSS